METSISFPSRLTTAGTGRPRGRLVASAMKSGICSSKRTFIGLPARLSSKSPALSPALAAGESSQTPAIRRPFSSGHSLNSGCGSSPSQLRWIFPLAINCPATALTRLAGIAPDKP